MKIEESKILATIPHHDREFIERHIFEVVDLIDHHPLSERICFLLDHQELGNKLVPDKYGRNFPPNCIGTAFYVIGAVSYPYRGYSNELSPYMNDVVTLDTMFDKHPERRVAGALIFSFCAVSDGWHAGVCLGEVSGNHLAFAQHGNGGSFGVETVQKNYSDPDYYSSQL